ncbi:MAG TPA: hypothetical protein P5186_27370 [Candidatus Paceibacterota bacterium]|nr:hypothetical protein [Candidatus Paceibacterota bacterium]
MTKFYAHTAELPDGTRDPDPDHWQRLSEHLCNVAALAKKFAEPLRLFDHDRSASRGKMAPQKLGNPKSQTLDSGEREALSLSLLDGSLDCPRRGR